MSLAIGKSFPLVKDGRVIQIPDGRFQRKPGIEIYRLIRQQDVAGEHIPEIQDLLVRLIRDDCPRTLLELIGQNSIEHQRSASDETKDSYDDFIFIGVHGINYPGAEPRGMSRGLA